MNDITPAELRQHQPSYCCNSNCNQGDSCPMRNDAAHCATEVGATERGRHYTGPFAALWLRLVRALG